MYKRTTRCQASVKYKDPTSTCLDDVVTEFLLSLLFGVLEMSSYIICSPSNKRQVMVSMMSYPCLLRMAIDFERRSARAGAMLRFGSNGTRIPQ